MSSAFLDVVGERIGFKKNRIEIDQTADFTLLN